MTDKIFGVFSSYFSNEYSEVFGTDVGDWIMKPTNTEGKIYRFFCPHNKHAATDKLSLLLRSLNCYVFSLIVSSFCMLLRRAHHQIKVT